MSHRKTLYPTHDPGTMKWILPDFMDHKRTHPQVGDSDGFSGVPCFGLIILTAPLPER